MFREGDPPRRQAMQETKVLVNHGGAADAPPAPPRCRSAPHPGPQSTSPAAPTAPGSAPAGSARHARPAPVALRPTRAPAATTPCAVLATRQRGPTAPGTPTQEEDRAPIRPAAELPVDRQPQRVAVEHPAALQVGWVQQHAAAQHVHGAMITQQTEPRRTACSTPEVLQLISARNPLVVICGLCALRPLYG